jgi:hypothetical protein
MHTESYWRNLLEDRHLGEKGEKKTILQSILRKYVFYDERWVELFRGCFRWSDLVMASLQSWHIESF